MQPAIRYAQLRESTIREMTRHAMQHNAINLSQGFPDYPAPETVLQAAVDAIQSGINQYTITWGYPPLRQKLAERYSRELGWSVDPDVHVTVTCGVTEGIVAAQSAILNPGDEMIIIEPAHENYRPAALSLNARPIAVPLEPPGYRLDVERLAAVVTPRTRGIVLNTPHNPTGRVFDEQEMNEFTEFVVAHDLTVITDEIYDNILYDGRVHVPPGRLDALRDRTITVSGLGKTFAVTGWRLGYVITPTPLASTVRQAHDFLTICAPTPLQAGAIAAFDLPQSYYEKTTREYHQRRDVMMGVLEEIGFTALMPEGAYYTIADFSQLPVPQAKLHAEEFALWMTREVGVAVVPMNSFYSVPGHGDTSVRFAFPKQLETLEEAAQRMAKIIK